MASWEDSEDYGMYYPTPEPSYTPYEAYYPEPVYQPTYEPPVVYPSDPYAGDAYYQPVPEPGQSDSYIPDWLASAGRGLGSYVANNPKDVLGMGLGAGMGLYGLLSAPDKTPAPDLRAQQAANAALQAQLAQYGGLNADAVAKLRAQIGGDYGDYANAAGARSGATAKLQQLLDQGPDYAMLPEEQRQLAELDQKWAAKGMLGSSLHNAEKQQLQAQFTNNALARYQSEVKSLTDTAANFSNQTSQQFQNTGNVVNTGAQTQVQGLSSLAQSGLQGAQLNQQNEQANNALQAQRSNQLLQTGGQIFGQSYANPESTIKKIQDTLKKNTGYTGMGG